MKDKTELLRDKSFYLGNELGEALPLSVEEALGKNLNDFRGWKCAIGVENMHITSDGEIYGAACRNNGHLGNVYDRSYFLPGTWHTCTRAACSCGADMQIRKVLDEKFISETYNDISDKIVSQVQNPVFSAPVHQEVHRKYPRTLTWDLGRRCNYSCSYCQPAISNNFESFRSMGSLLFALEGIEEYFLKDLKAKFTFTGGEPTINPAYMDFVKILKDKGHCIHTTTNGSRLPDYYSELIELSFIGFSYHLEFAKIERFKEVLKAIILKKQNSKAAYDHWCGIRIMVPPGKFSEAQMIHTEICKLENFKNSEIFVYMSPCYDKFEHTNLMSYSELELNRINSFS